MANTSTTELDLLKAVTVSGGATDQLSVTGSTTGAFSSPVSADTVTVDYPTSVQEVYKFRSGGISGTVLKTVTLNYSDSTKSSLQSGVVS